METQISEDIGERVISELRELLRLLEMKIKLLRELQALDSESGSQ